ncbi:hypothetical protein R1sor_012870 [Riccia sorocarpa]|uniref:peptidylprolyl isomerase n=1 Tax=Riccia sorocarpa TaxID=122646 RepID=A0ABD3IB56_9MARC
MAHCNFVALSSSFSVSPLQPLTSDLPVTCIHRDSVIQSRSWARSSLARDLDPSVVSRREVIVQLVSTLGFLASGGVASAEQSEATRREGRPKFYELEGSGGVKALDIREGDGASPLEGEKVVIHYYARLAAKQGWRFDSTYEHKDQFGAPEPYVFTVGSGDVISGLDAAVRSMREGGVRRVVIPPSQGYQNTTQGPIPPDYFDRQRLYTTIFNPTRLANGEGSTLGTLIFDIELLKIRRS